MMTTEASPAADSFALSSGQPRLIAPAMTDSPVSSEPVPSAPPREREATTSSSVSVTSSDYRSIKSSPSPPHADGQPEETKNGSRFLRNSPAFSTFGGTGSDLGSSIPDIQRKPDVFVPTLQTNGTLFADEDKFSVGIRESKFLPPGAGRRQQDNLRSLWEGNPQDLRNNSVPVPIFNPVFTSSSPTSSSGSGGPHISTLDPLDLNRLEGQLRASPFVADILDRLLQCEANYREVRRDLNEIGQKVNLLLDRSMGIMAEPEFLNPFASAGNSRSVTPSGLFPPQHNLAPRLDEIAQLSQRLNALTTSVGQLMATQSRQQINNVNSGLPLQGPQFSRQSIDMRQSIDIPPNQPLLTPPVSAQALLGHGLPQRQDLRPSPRIPTLPTRTWSAGNLELPVRGAESHMNRPDHLPRDKRRSMAANMVRRESTGVMDPGGDHGTGNHARDNGPLVTKWEHLPLLPELLRALSKFGVGPPNKIQQRALPFLLRGSDIIAQAPPTQERIAAYVIPAIHVALTHINTRMPTRGPLVLMISTTVDQATQAQRMIRDIGSAIGVRSALGVGSTSSDIMQEARQLQQSNPHILCGTPQKLHALFSTPGGLVGSEVRFLVLDEVDQLIARNMHEFVHNILKFLPPPRPRPSPSLGPSPMPPSQSHLLEAASSVTSLLPGVQNGRRASAFVSGTTTPISMNESSLLPSERQTALFSNTVPQDVLNLATTMQLREPVRVLVRRDGSGNNPEANQGSRGLRQFYLYLAFTGSGRSDGTASVSGTHGIIGSGRSAAETAQAREWKLDALADLFTDIEGRQAIVHVGSMPALDSVVYKLASAGLEAVPLHGEMNAGTKLAALNKFRNSSLGIVRQAPITKVLVIFDVQVKSADVHQVSLIINYDLPRAVEEYAQRVAPAISNNNARAGVVVNFVTATGGDVEMLRSIECFYKIKCPEVPMSLRDLV